MDAHHKYINDILCDREVVSYLVEDVAGEIVLGIDLGFRFDAFLSLFLEKHKRGGATSFRMEVRHSCYIDFQLRLELLTVLHPQGDEIEYQRNIIFL